MKKSILYIGIALMGFMNASYAHTTSDVVAIEAKIGGPTPLCVAISKGDVEVVKKFIEYGADVNEKSNGMTPLMIAVRYNNVELVQYLISKGADINAKSDNGFTARKWAEAAGANEAAALLASPKK